MRWAVPFLILCLSLPLSATAQQQAVSAELIRLHDALHLSAGQEAAWMRYTRAIAPNNNQAQARHQATDSLLASLSTPRRIALIEATMAADEADFRRESEAVTAFYATLSPEQQRTFDRETLPPQGQQR